MDGQNTYQIIALLGSLASLIGIPIAIVSVIQARNAARRSATASQEANEKISKFREDIRLLTQVVDLEKAIGLMGDIKSFVRNKTYWPIPDRIEQLIDYLNKVRSPSMNLPDDIKIRIQTAVTELRRIEENIDDTDLFQERPQNSQSFNKRISRHIDDLQPILTDLKNKIGEPKNDPTRT